MKYLTIFLIAVFLVFAPVNVYSQDQEGLRHYQKGEYKKAADAFNKELRKNSSDPVLWNYLGLSLDKTGDLKGARSAFEKAIGFNPSFSAYHSNLTFVLIKLKKFGDAKDSATNAINLDPANVLAYYFRSVAYFNLDDDKSALKDARQSITYNEKFAASYLIESKILVAQVAQKWSEKESEIFYATIDNSIASLEKCVENCEGDLSDIRRELENILALREYLKQKEDDAKTNSAAVDTVDGSESMKVKTMPPPKSTTSAKDNRVRGTVRLAVVFGSNGVIGPIAVVQGLPDGLTESAIKAANGITFKPEMRDGTPVTVVKTVVFNFELL